MTTKDGNDLTVFIVLYCSGSSVGVGGSHQVTRTPSARQSPSASSLSRSGGPKSGSQTTLDKDEQSADMTGSKFDLVSSCQSSSK